MRLLQYMGHHHVAWCNWQGHSNGWKLRIGFKKKNDPYIVFYISWFWFYFYVCKTENGVKFRYLCLLRHNPIYFSSKQTRTIDHLAHIVNKQQDEIDKLNKLDTIRGKQMRELVKLYANTIRINEDYQFEERVEVSLKEEMYGHEFHNPHHKRLITFKK